MNSICEQPALHSIEQAIDALTHLLARPIEAVNVPLARATGQRLSEDVHAQLDVPRWDNSAMDGYALNSADLVNGAGSLSLVGCQAAGDPLRPLPPGHCMQIFTGAPIPFGADTVVPQENCHRQADEVTFNTVKAGQNIRRLGEETRVGQLLLGKGTLLRAQEIGLLASQGHAQVKACHPLRIGIISSGNELCEPGAALADSQIYDTNRYLLASLLQGWGFQISQYPHLRDNLADTLQLLNHASKEQDILISSGGVSVGEADYLKSAVQQLGKLNLWQVAIQPGKPLAFGRVGNTPWIGLPGNPAASLITALVIARPALLAAQGQANTLPQPLPAQADFTRSKPKLRTQYLQARLEVNGDKLLAQLHPQQSSAMLANCCWADGLVIILPHQTVYPGDTVRFIPYQSLQGSS